MKTLLIFDHSLYPKHLDSILKNHISSINLFPLTSNALAIDNIKKKLVSLFHVEADTLESAKCIDAEVSIMQKTIHTWSCQMGNAQIGKKKLKEWLILPDKNVSSWWFGLISEKNTTQDTAFFTIAQINAIGKHVQDNKYELCLIALSDNRQAKILVKLLKKHHLNAHLISPSYIKKFKQALIDQFYTGMLPALFRAVSIGIKWLAYSQFIKCILPPLKKRLPDQHAFLFVSYFPNVVNEAAKLGVFQNKYALALQDKLKERHIPITWVTMPVNYNEYNLKSAVSLAKRFLNQGEKLFVIYEFFNIKTAITGFFWWLRQLILCCTLYCLIDKKILTSKLTHEECLPIIKYLWWHSLIGASGTRGILYYLTYKELFRRMPNSQRCLYYCEMQAWEKALNAAKKLESPQTKTLAFQHTIVMRNLFNYFYDDDELLQMNQASDLPLPDLLIANGKKMHALLASCQYPGLYEAEAIRQLYLNKIIEKPALKNLNRRILFVVGSFNRNETKSLISMLYSAFPKADQFEIWCKGYPYTPLENLFLELHIDINKTGYQIKQGDIASMLDAASIVFVPGSAVAMEAVAYGCTVMVPVFSDVIQLNPLVEVNTHYFLVTSACDLKKLVESEMAKEEKATHFQSKELIQEYWNLDPALPLWDKIFAMT